MPSPIKVLDQTYVTTIGEGDEAIVLYEITTSVTDGLWLLRPDPRCVELVNGVLGRTQLIYRFELYGYHVLSTHMHSIVGLKASDVSLALHTKAESVGHTNANIAKEINRLRKRTGSLWLRPNRPIQIADEATAVERLRYVMCQAIEANVVPSAANTPFPSANPWLLEGRSIEGLWVDRSGMYDFWERTGHVADEDDFTTVYPVVISKLPHLRHLSDDQYRAFCRALVRPTEMQARRDQRAGTRRFTGAAYARGIDPFHRTPYEDRPNSPAPAIHGPMSARRAFRKVYRALRAALRVATVSWREFLRGVDVEPLPCPLGTQPPGNLRSLVAHVPQFGEPQMPA